MSYKGPYKVKNVKKYKGNAASVTYRSLKERSIMAYFDSSPKVLQWNSEEVIVPYYYEVDKKMHRYFVDFYAVIKCNDGTIKKLMIEFKPACQTVPPKPSKSKSPKIKRRKLMETLTYIKNRNKWDAATLMANKYGMEFVVISEGDIWEMKYFKAL